MKFNVDQILDLPEMKVLNFQEVEEIGIIITIEKNVNYCACPSCRHITHSIHQNHWRMIRDLSWSGKMVLLNINRRQFKCNKCQKVFSEQLDFVERNKRYTKRLAVPILDFRF
jgi:transposase